MRQTIHKYKQWRHTVQRWAKGHLRFLGVYGNPGLSKTFTILDALGYDNCVYVRCHGSPLDFYKKLADAAVKKLPIVLDDVDNLLKNQTTLNLLKGAFDQDGKIQWNSTTSKLGDVSPEIEIPDVKIALISNEEMIFTKHLDAVEDRGLVCHMAVDAQEVHSDVGAWWPKVTEDVVTKNGNVMVPFFDQEVYDYMAQILDIIKYPSQRAYTVSALNKRDGLDWTQIVQDTFCLDPELQFVRLLMLDPTLTSEERVAEYAKKFQRSRATFFRRQDEITASLGIKPVAYDPRMRLERDKALGRVTPPTNAQAGRDASEGASSPATAGDAENPPEVATGRMQTSEAARPPVPASLEWRQQDDGNQTANYRNASIRRETRNKPGKNKGTETIWWVSGVGIPGIGEDTHFPSFEDARRAVEEAWASEKEGK